MAEITWIKLKTTMFDDEKIRLIQALPEADAILVIWIRLLVLAGKTNDDGLIYIQRNMPYSDEMLSTLFAKPINIIRLALNTLCQFQMIDLDSDGVISIANWEKHQNVEGMDKIREQNRLRKAKEREKKRIECDVTGQSRDSHATDLDLDLEEDKDKDINTLSSSDKELEENSEKEKKTSCKYSDEHLRLATKLRDNLLEDFPNEMGKAKLDEWANVFRLMEERDNATIEQIEYVVDWLPKNDFWSKNIRSAKKLRKQFEVLKKEIKSEKERPKKAYNNKPIKQEKLPDWAKENPVEQPEVQPISEERKRQIEKMVQMIEDG